jgi:glucose-6-phosphate isomerase
MKLALGRYEDAVRKCAGELAPGVERMWRRDASFWGADPTRQKSVANRLGWLDVPASMRANVPGLTAFADEVRAAGYRDAVVLGMGGSSLAPEVLRRAIASQARTRDEHLRLHILDTTDPSTIADVNAVIDPAHTLFFVSSKSGSTIEANVLYEYFTALVADSTHSDPGANFVAVTDAGTLLEQLARDRSFRRVFINPSDIGGRYSALSYFGLAPAAVAGVDIGRLLSRAIAASSEARTADSADLLFGGALGVLAREGRDKLTIIASPSIASFGLWAEQLIAESTGKEGTGIVPIDGEPLGRPKQYGDDRAFIYVRLEADSNGHTDATAGALVAEGYPVIRIDLEDVYDLGREFFRWEFAVAVAGNVLGINPFDEPNVQESKDNTNRVLQQFETSGRLDNPALDDKMPVAMSSAGASTVDPAVASLLSNLRPGDYLAITAYIQQSEYTDAIFADIRARVRDAFDIATTLGYGPRFLHSTGQLHKGGPPKGAFLQVTAVDTDDVPIPGRPFTFGQLKRAQAIGDYESLVAHGRPVVRVHLQRDITGGLEHLRRGVIAVTRVPA